MAPQEVDKTKLTRDEKIGAIKNFIPIILGVAIVFVGMYSGGLVLPKLQLGCFVTLIVGIINRNILLLKTCEVIQRNG